MAFDITVEQVREIVPDLSASDASIQMQIDIVQCKIGACLEASYSDCEAVGRAILIYTVAYLADKGADNKGSITARQWADGDSESYGDKSDNSNSYWDQVLMLDTAGCSVNAFRSNKVFAVTGSAVRVRGC